MKKWFLAVCLLAPTMGAMSQTTGTEVPATDASIRYVGRTLVGDDHSVSFDWVGSYLETVLTGRELSVRLTEKGESYYNVFVDDVQQGVVKSCGTDTVIRFVNMKKAGTYRIRLQKRSEGEFGRTTILGLLPGKDGKLKAVTEIPTRHIEFIGDSYTCGFGTEGLDRNEPFKLETENCNLAYGVLTARYFGADYTLIAHSGRGAVRNYGDSKRVSDISMADKIAYLFDGPDGKDSLRWNGSEGYQPSLVVINLGTNDFSVEPHPYRSEFVMGYTKLLKGIRSLYGAEVPILCIYQGMSHSPVYEWYVEAVEKMNDPHIHYIRLKDDILNSTTDRGSVWHPNQNGQRKMAMSVIPYIATLMDWPLEMKVVK